MEGMRRGTHHHEQGRTRSDLESYPADAAVLIPASADAALVRHCSVVAQSMHGSVIDTPYFSFDLSLWIG